MPIFSWSTPDEGIAVLKNHPGRIRRKAKCYGGMEIGKGNLRTAALSAMSIHGESAHGGVHTGGAQTGRAHLEEYTQRSTHGGSKYGESTHGETDMEEYSFM